MTEIVGRRSASPDDPRGGDPASPDATDGAVSGVILDIGAILLQEGAPTDDVERAMTSVAATVGLSRPTVVVSFGTIALSYPSGPASEPVTALRLVTQRTTDLRRLAAATALVSELCAHTRDIRGAADEVARIEHLPRAWPGSVAGIAQAVCAGASALLFGGTAIDALATIVVSATLVAVVVRLDRSGLPPFFRSLIGPLVSSFLVTGAVAIHESVNPVPVLAGSLLPFLPGGALVAGMRDLIDQSVVSGTARLAEALLLSAAVAAGTAIGIELASHVDVTLDTGAADPEIWPLPIQGIAAAIACATWAARLGAQRAALLAALALGAVGWVALVAVSSLDVGSIAATAGAGLVIGGASRILARRADDPVVHWVIPASLPLLPGVAIVYGMLADDPVDGLGQLATAAATALALGSAIAFGDILVRTIRAIRGGIGGSPARAAKAATDRLWVAAVTGGR